MKPSIASMMHLRIVAAMAVPQAADLRNKKIFGWGHSIELLVTTFPATI